MEQEGSESLRKNAGQVVDVPVYQRTADDRVTQQPTAEEMRQINDLDAG